MTRDVSVFIKNDTIFGFFFQKLPQIRTSKFRKAVWRHTEGMILYGLCCKFTSLSGSERILKIH